MYKERCRFDVGLRELMGGCPREYIEILRYIDTLRYYDTPDYKRIYTLLRHAGRTLGANEYPYDWEPKVRKIVIDSFMQYYFQVPSSATKPSSSNSGGAKVSAKEKPK